MILPGLNVWFRRAFTHARCGLPPCFKRRETQAARTSDKCPSPVGRRLPARRYAPLIALAALLLASAARGEPFSFAAWGDVPYSRFERDIALDMLAEQAAQPLAFSIHVGDIKSGSSPCDDALLDDRHALLDGSAHALLLLAGDNEWTDCARPAAGSRAPFERLNAWRARFHGNGESLGQQRLSPARQSCCPENMRWLHGGVLFATLNVSGSPLPPGKPARQLEAATLDWLDAAFSEAHAANAAAMVIVFHANPRFEAYARGHGVKRYRALLDRLARRAAHFGRPLLLIHGDSHRYRVDQPLFDRKNGRYLDNVTRLEVHGSPWLGWTRVEVDAASPTVFSFEPHTRRLP